MIASIERVANIAEVLKAAGYNTFMTGNLVTPKEKPGARTCLYGHCYQ